MTQLPLSQPRPPATQHAKRLRPKTYSVAVYLVFAIVLLQVAMVISIFWLRAMVVPVKVQPPKPGGKKHQQQPTANQPLIGPEAPKVNPTVPKKNLPNLPNLPGLSASRPRAALLSVPTSNDRREQIRDLNDQAVDFQKVSAYESAIETLTKAEDIDPRFPITLKNIAETYYLMNDPIHAKAYWQRLVDLGPGTETLYATAKDHVVLLSGPEADPLTATSDYARQIYIASVEKTPVETKNGQAQFHLRAGLARQTSTMPSFDQKKLQPYVIFYQQMPDGSLVPDLGQRKGSFDDTFLFWGSKTNEAFGVDYVLPLPGSLGPNNTPQGEYYGFVIGIYYNKVLQDARSEPADLITRIPLPNEIE